MIDGALFTGAETGNAEPLIQTGALRRSTPRFEVTETVVWFPPSPQTPPQTPNRTPSRRGDPALLWVGRAEPVKDPLNAVAAFELVATEAPAAHLTMIVQVGSLSRCLADRVAASSWRDQIDLVGPLPRAELPAWYAAADVFVSTSRSEGSGYALLEAITCGCRAVAVTDLPSHRAILGVDRVGPPPGEPVSMAGHVRSVLAAPSSPISPPDTVGQLREAYRNVT